MVPSPSVLCPVDFSDASRGALRYAIAIAAHFGAKLRVFRVDEPPPFPRLGPDAAPHVEVDTVDKLKRFFVETCPKQPHGLTDLRLDVATGRPAVEILLAARESKCDLIVMSSHGARGFRKLIFGSTTERVLRQTPVPVLVTPGNDPGPEELEGVTAFVRRILVPVDFTAATAHQVGVGGGLAEALGVPVLLLHVLEPPFQMVPVDVDGRVSVELEIERVAAALPARLAREMHLACGRPAEEIARIARERDARLIVMALHSSPLGGPRMGAVTYRVLCWAQRLVLAVPPSPAKLSANWMEVQRTAIVS